MESVFLFSLFQQLSGEEKQMAKAMTEAAKAAAKAPTKKRPSTSSQPAYATSLPPAKRRSFKPDKVIVCYSCQQTGHIAPQCPNNKQTASSSASSSSSKSSSKK